MSGEDVSSKSNEDFDNVHPYAASVDKPHTVYPTPPKRYSSRLAWKDRRALLKSGKFIRLSAIFAAITHLTEISLQFDRLRVAWVFYGIGSIDILDVAAQLLALMSVIASLFAILLSVAQWRYAEDLVAVAGGRDDEWNRVTVAHQRLWFLTALVWGIAVLNVLGIYLLREITHAQLMSKMRKL